MNPTLLVFLFLLIYKENNTFPNYYDTFQLERLLNELQYTINSLDKINHLNELAHSPWDRNRIMPTLEDSIHTVRPLLPSNSIPMRHLNDIENMLGKVHQLNNLQGALQTYGPMLKTLMSSNSGLPENTYTDDDSGISLNTIMSVINQIKKEDSQ